MKNMIIKHCNRPDYLDRLWNPSSLEILEMWDRHYYLYLHKPDHGGNREITSSLTLLWTYASEKKKAEKTTKNHHATKTHKQVKNNQPKKITKNPKTKHHKTHTAENQFAY